MRTIRLKIGNWKPKPGSGWEMGYRLARLNGFLMGLEVTLAIFCAILSYTPAVFLRKLVYYLERDPERNEISWGIVFCAGLFVSNALLQLRECTS